MTTSLLAEGWVWWEPDILAQSFGVANGTFTPPPLRMLTMTEAARACGLDRHTIWDAIRNGRLPAEFQSGGPRGRWLIHPRWLLHWFASRRRIRKASR